MWYNAPASSILSGLAIGYAGHKILRKNDTSAISKNQRPDPLFLIRLWPFILSVKSIDYIFLGCVSFTAPLQLHWGVCSLQLLTTLPNVWDRSIVLSWGVCPIMRFSLRQIRGNSVCVTYSPLGCASLTATTTWSFSLAAILLWFDKC